MPAKKADAADAVFPLHVGRHTPWERDHAREVWDAFRARLAPPAGREDEAAVERAARALYAAHDISALTWEGASEATREVFREHARTVLAAARGPRPVEDEAAVERAARAAYAAFNGEEMPAQSIRLGQWRSVARAALAAARGPRTPDPGAGA